MMEDLSKTREMRNFEWGNATHIGKVRAVNEDYYGYFNTKNGHIFVICDGMGGHTAGEKASRMAVESIRRFFDDTWHEFPKIALNYAIVQANHDLYYETRKHPELSGMGTTIVIALIRDNKVYYAHAGDSRIYRFTKGNLQKLTTDHSHVQDLIKQGIITEEEAKNHPRRNQITSALGVAEEIAHVSIASQPILPYDNDILLMCSDGLYSMLSENEISQLLNSTEKIQDIAMLLTQKANENGGNDNITVQLIRFYNTGNKAGNFISITPKIFSGNKKIFSTKIFIISILLLSIVFISFFLYRNNKQIDAKNFKQTKSVSKKNIENQTDSTTINLKPDTLVTIKLEKDIDVKDILKKYHLSDVQFLRYNNINEKTIKKGRQLKIPFQAIYKVKSGDNLSKLAREYRVNPQQIIEANSLKDSKIIPGQKLLIPLM